MSAAMTLPEQQLEAFYSGIRSERLPLCVNDIVTVLAGRKPNERAYVISLQSIEPSVTYLVEYGDGSDELVALEHLRLAA
jgi:hypothetical protein